MLAVANLIENRDVAIKEMMAIGLSFEQAIDALGSMDSTTESITLATASFDELPPKCQNHLKRSIEVFMVPFGGILLSAYQVSLRIGNSEPLRILEEALKSACQKIGALASESGIDFPD